MMSLYPLKFKSILKDKIWGGKKMSTILGKNIGTSEHCGESWEISGIVGDESEVENGFLAENNLNELIEVYMTDLVGEKNYEKYGLGFPLLFKFIDAQDDLSVQVHPDDELAKSKYDMNGKTEMWHVIQAEPGSGLIVGFNKKISKAEYEKAFAEKNLESIVRFYPVKAGDTFFIPAGTLHAIGKGILLAEIQQSSDITFRIYDWNRVDKDGNSRELHIEEALEALHFDEEPENYKVDYTPKLNTTVKMVRSPFFNTNYLEFDKPLQKTYAEIDSFVAYMCTEGSIELVGRNFKEQLKAGESVLVPAAVEELQLIPSQRSKVLEVYC